jgi:Uma2 family endonuclease
MKPTYETNISLDTEKNQRQFNTMNEYQEKISLEEFFALLERDPEHRYELIDGYPCMMTGGSPDHAIIGLNIGSILREQLRKRPCIAYNSDVYIELDGEENCLCPDASVSCDRRDRYATKGIHYPCLIAEVLSPGTKARDRGIKADLYQNMPSVQEILFVDTKIMRIQLYRREADLWTMRNFIHSDDIIELTSLGIHITVLEVYEKTTFDESFAEE